MVRQVEGQLVDALRVAIIAVDGEDGVADADPFEVVARVDMLQAVVGNHDEKPN